MNNLNWIVASLTIVLAVIIVAMYWVNWVKTEKLDNHINDVLMRTGGSQGSMITNLMEFTQPGQGEQNDWDSLAYQYVWNGNMPTNTGIGYHSGRPLVEHLVDNRCGGYSGNNAYLERHLNVRNPDGSVNWGSFDNFYGQDDMPMDPERATQMMAAKNKARYDQCLKTQPPSQCAVSLHDYVTDSLRANAYSG